MCRSRYPVRYNHTTLRTAIEYRQTEAVKFLAEHGVEFDESCFETDAQKEALEEYRDMVLEIQAQDWYPKEYYTIWPIKHSKDYENIHLEPEMMERGLAADNEPWQLKHANYEAAKNQ